MLSPNLVRELPLVPRKLPPSYHTFENTSVFARTQFPVDSRIRLDEHLGNEGDLSKNLLCCALDFMDKRFLFYFHKTDCRWGGNRFESSR